MLPRFGWSKDHPKCSWQLLLKNILYWKGVHQWQKYISYLLNGNEFDSLGYEATYFLNKDLKTIFKKIKHLTVEKINLDLDILYDLIKQVEKTELTRFDLETIKNNSERGCNGNLRKAK